jgi:hypothetical protein
MPTNHFPPSVEDAIATIAGPWPALAAMVERVERHHLVLARAISRGVMDPSDGRTASTLYEIEASYAEYDLDYESAERLYAVARAVGALAERTGACMVAVDRHVRAQLRTDAAFELGVSAVTSTRRVQP